MEELGDGSGAGASTDSEAEHVPEGLFKPRFRSAHFYPWLPESSRSSSRNWSVGIYV